MRKFILFASFAVVSASLYGMQCDFYNETNVERTKPMRLPLTFDHNSSLRNTTIDKKENGSSPIQGNIFESQNKGNQKDPKYIFSDFNDKVSISSVDDVSKEILHSKEKTGQSEIFGNATQTLNVGRLIIGKKRKSAENVENDPDKQKMVRRLNDDRLSIRDKRNATSAEESFPENNNKKRRFVEKTISTTTDPIVGTKSNKTIELKKEIEEIKSQIELLRTSKIRTQQIHNDKVENRIEELQNLVLEREVELELEKANNSNDTALRREKELTNQLQRVQKFVSTAKQEESPNTSKLKTKPKVGPIKQKIIKTYENHQSSSRTQGLALFRGNNNKFEHSYGKTNKKSEALNNKVDESVRKTRGIDKNLEDSKNEISKIQGRYEMELNKKEFYKSEVNRLNQMLANERRKSEQMKKENTQISDTLNSILAEERSWQNMLRALSASQKINADFREYLLRLMKHSNARSFINRFSNDDKQSKEIIRQLLNNSDIKKHFERLDDNRYFWSPSKISREGELFSKSEKYDERLSNELKYRNVRIQKQLNRIIKDNDIMVEIIKELRKDSDIERYIRDALEFYQLVLTKRVDEHLAWSKSRKKQ